MASLGNNPIRVNAGNKCLNPFCISTYLLALSRDNHDLWCAGWIEHLKVSSRTTPVSNYLSYLLITRENLPVNTVIFSSNNLPFSSHFTDHLNRRKKANHSTWQTGTSLILLLQFVFVISKAQDHGDKPRKNNGFETSLFLFQNSHNMQGTSCFKLQAQRQTESWKNLEMTNLFAFTGFA